MQIITIFLIAFALTIDTFAISVTSGLAIKDLKISNSLKIAFFFAITQATMPFIGWLIGEKLRDLISEVDHWISFGLLTFIGGKMIYESLMLKSVEKKIDPLNTKFLITISIATSIDALAVGLGFGLLNTGIIWPIIIIGIMTFLISYLGVYVGNKLGHLFENKIEIAGGLILIGIGLKILFEHLRIL